jgi:hypothetical protein
MPLEFLELANRLRRAAENAVRRLAVWAPLVAAFLLAASFAHALARPPARADARAYWNDGETPIPDIEAARWEIGTGVPTGVGNRGARSRLKLKLAGARLDWDAAECDARPREISASTLESFVGARRTRRYFVLHENVEQLEEETDER